MTYRRKLLLALIAFALLTNSLSLTVLYQLAHHYLYLEYRAKVQSIAITTARLVDGESVLAVRTERDDKSPAYIALQKQLRDVRDANRRDDTKVERLFTVAASAMDPKVIEIGADPEENPQVHGRPGEVYRTGGLGLDLSRAAADEEFVVDQFGTYFRAHAPVFDKAGKPAGAVVVETQPDWVKRKLRPLLWSILLSLALALLLAIPAAAVIASWASRPLRALREAVNKVAKGDLAARLDDGQNDEFGEVARAVNGMAAGLQERDRVKSAFARYVSHQVMDSIMASGTDGVLRGDRRRVSVLFSDIRGFSTISENLPPETVVQVLNEYFEVMVEVIFRHRGTLDKFIGDGLMALFGAPEEDPRQEEHALMAAIEMQSELEKLSRKWEPLGVKLKIGIGINTGPAIVGSIGSPRRREYTAVGDTVNVASRLESATKDLGVNILVSEFTYYAVKSSFPFQRMGTVQVKGRQEPLTVYSVDSPAA